MALAGELADMPLIDLLRVFQQGARSGRLVLVTEAEWAMVWFRGGQAVHALVLTGPERRPAAAGEAALAHILSWPDGRFRFLPCTQPIAQLVTIRRPTATLIAEALRRRAAQTRPALPPGLTATTPLRVLPQLAGDDEIVHMSVDEWLVLTQIERQTTPAEIAAQTRLSIERTLALVVRLIELGLVAPAPLACLPARRLTVEPPAAPPAHPCGPPPITNLTRAIRRRLTQLSLSSA